LLSAGAGIATYSILKGWNLILLIVTILLLGFGLAFILRRQRHEMKTSIKFAESELPSQQVTGKQKQED
jgi:preprotein translocase subunit YajC